MPRRRKTRAWSARRRNTSRRWKPAGARARGVCRALPRPGGAAGPVPGRSRHGPRRRLPPPPSPHGREGGKTRGGRPSGRRSPRRLSHRARDRPRRHGRRLRGRAIVAGPPRRPQGAAVRGGAGRPPVAALQERGPGGGPAAPHQHRAGVRGGLRARHPFLRHAAHRGTEPRRADPADAIRGEEGNRHRSRGAANGVVPRRPASLPPFRRRDRICPGPRNRPAASTAVRPGGRADRRSIPRARPASTRRPRGSRPRRPTRWNTPTSST